MSYAKVDCFHLNADAKRLNPFVSSAVVGRVCQCKILAKYGCSVTTALGRAHIEMQADARQGRAWQEDAARETLRDTV